jgi:hypothetical protein
MDPREPLYLLTTGASTFGNVAASFPMIVPATVKFPGIDIELSKVLHASESVLYRMCVVYDTARCTQIWNALRQQGFPRLIRRGRFLNA